MTSLLWCSASFTGARKQNEDRFTAYPPLFGMHDGHSGTQAVSRLQTVIYDHTANRLPNALKDGCLHERIPEFLADMYADAQRHMCWYLSGAVSLSAVVVGDNIFLANVGDCEACVFDATALDACVDANPVCMGSLTVTDTLTADTTTEVGALQTRPHALRGGIKGWSVCHTTDLGIKYGIPTGFHDLNSQREWELACRTLPPSSLPARMVDIPGKSAEEASQYQGLMRVESMEYAGTTYSRFMGSVEPTRSLGDSHCCIVRTPEIYHMRLSSPSTAAGGRAPERYLVMCTDGFFEGGAFADMRALTSFLSSPLAFIRRRLYHPAQSATRRLIAARHLPRTLVACKTRGVSWLTTPPLFRQWRECDTWAKALLLLERHLVCMGPAHDDLEQRWVAASKDALEWITTSTGKEAPTLLRSPQIMAETAARMAVIMGSSDNATILIAKLE